MSELRKAEGKIQTVLETFSSLDEKDLDESTCLLYQRIANDLEEETGPLVERLLKRSKKVDVETGEPIYGPKTQARISRVSESYETITKKVESIMERVASFLEGLAKEREQEAKRLAEVAAREEVIIRERSIKQIKEQEKLQKQQQEDEKRMFEQRLAQATEVIKTVVEDEIQNDPQQVLLRKIREEKSKIRVDNGSGESQLRHALNDLGIEKGDRVKAISLLEMFLKNIVAYPENKLYRSIKIDNQHFLEKIASVSGGRECMIAMGFELCIQEDNVVYFMNEPDTMEEMEAWVSWFDSLKVFLEILEEVKGS